MRGIQSHNGKFEDEKLILEIKGYKRQDNRQILSVICPEKKLSGTTYMKGGRKVVMSSAKYTKGSWQLVLCYLEVITMVIAACVNGVKLIRLGRVTHTSTHQYQPGTSVRSILIYIGQPNTDNWFSISIN